jgi:hypothetical protein
MGHGFDPEGVAPTVYDRLCFAAPQLIAHHWAAYRREVEARAPRQDSAPHGDQVDDVSATGETSG